MLDLYQKNLQIDLWGSHYEVIKINFCVIYKKKISLYFVLICLLNFVDAGNERELVETERG